MAIIAGNLIVKGTAPVPEFTRTEAITPRVNATRREIVSNMNIGKMVVVGATLVEAPTTPGLSYSELRQQIDMQSAIDNAPILNDKPKRSQYQDDMKSVEIVFE
jgi:hypothetical protein